MVENISSTLAPEKLPPPSHAASISSEKKALFDSIVKESDPTDEMESSKIKAIFAGLLWLGYATAVVVALVLVWSAAGSLLKSFAR